MQDAELSEVTDLDDIMAAAADALARANEELQACRSSEQRLESMLVGVLDHVPVPVVLVDDGLAVRACSGAARSHGMRPGSPLEPPLAEAVARLIEPRPARPARTERVGGWHVAPLESEEVPAILWGDPLAS
jgi:hypothetical protein